uniref:Venom peptide HtLa13 n=1 Tax=Hadogenes troglodytes TaxID=1577150 RepID=A0A1B3IJ47_9SCOR|nr:venom peptide HtLa13 [Hadogenes troglodytes]
MRHLCVAVLLGCLSLCAMPPFTIGAGEVCEVGALKIPVGQEKQDPNSCAKYKCITQNNRLVLNKLECVIMNTKRGCKSVPGDVKAPFPDCCSISLCRGGQWDKN